MFIVQDTFSRKLSEKFQVEEQDMSTDGSVKKIIVVPPGVDPSVELKNEWEELEQELVKIREQGGLLISKLRLYFEDENLETNYKKLSLCSGRCHQYLRRAYNSKIDPDVAKHAIAFHEESKELIKLTALFEKMLVSAKIKKITV